MKSTHQVVSRYIKCVIVGDSGVGKTSLISRFTKDEFPTDVQVFDHFCQLVKLKAPILNKSGEMKDEEIIVNLDLWDTHGSHEFDRLRPLGYSSTDVSTVKSRFNESRFNAKSRFKEWNLVTKMEFHIKKSRFSVKSKFKEWKGADGGHSLNRDFTVGILVANDTQLFNTCSCSHIFLLCRRNEFWSYCSI